jgi:hypothetical protein
MTLVRVQFEGRRTYGRVAQGGTGPTKVKQMYVPETAQAKSVVIEQVASNVKGG